MLNFEWDQSKAVSNLAKHGVSFTEASTVFDDPYARVIADPDHSLSEERYVILGLSLQARELVVCHCLRGNRKNVIRIISARKATRREASQYWRRINA